MLKDMAKSGIRNGEFGLGEVLINVAYHLGFAAFGFLSSKGIVFSTLLPFGMSVVGGAALKYTAAASVGAVLGYLMTSASVLSFRYVAAVMAIAAVRLLIGGTAKKEIRPMFSAIIVLLVAASTGIVTVQGDQNDVFKVCIESALAASGAYFTAYTYNALSRHDAGLHHEELSALLITVSLPLIGLFGIEFYGMSAGRFLCAVIILLSVRYGGTAVGTICGVAFGFAALIGGADSSLVIVYSFGAMVSGVFSKLGRIASALSFIISIFISVALIGTVESLIYSVESILAAAVFLIVPQSIGIKVGKILSPASEIAAPNSLKKSVIMRLNFAANALSDVSDTVEKVAEKLSQINTPDFSCVISGVENEACKGCSLRLHCWESKKQETVSAVLDITKAVKQGENEPQNFTDENFAGRCLRIDAVGQAVAKHYKNYASKIAAENRIDEVRSVVSDQFDGISSMLKDMSSELEKGETFDNSAAESVSVALKDIDIRAEECCCRIDKYGRMTVEIRVGNPKKITMNRMQIMKTVSSACNRDFDAPCINDIGNEAMITLCEQAVLSVDVGVNQIPCADSSMCGDAYSYFNDGKGRIIMILSDGMGSGGRAAVDGAMAAGLMGRLLKAGFGYDCSLSILNSSMLFKSTDESLATVDISVIDLFSGRTDLFKAGAAPTLVRRSGRTGKAQSTSLPAGILRDVGFDKATIRLHKGDILLMMSDGVTAQGTEWICSELENWGEGTAQELSEHIAECARRRRNDNHEDDITVMSAIIEKHF